ncbi:hypothetical protein FAM14222_001605 [Propionibacterium freudenreichii]|nr:hypothetical protein [Propionibacterium freudenreichii]MDK9593271.1 hypothetical protein [Propionibacterium freudenreichii]
MTRGGDADRRSISVLDGVNTRSLSNANAQKIVDELASGLATAAGHRSSRCRRPQGMSVDAAKIREWHRASRVIFSTTIKTQKKKPKTHKKQNKKTKNKKKQRKKKPKKKKTKK